ncbi:hypothetical protein DFH08DRAFT_333725 [Mycena albidolilacea]|uniref:F-box domain-containing protein n=1 Tax=Mycena albidolilacea TaxID=1033008 RepID=A0AAD7EJQ3_9AGAR|nr:hypothetical protein DFH08DRAFT_333725 [Mycena albidolilacea]
MSFLDLSLELLEEITYWVPADHSQLRMVCRNLNFAVAPSFFSSLVLDVHSSRLELGLSHLEALAVGNSQWSQFAHTLKIKRLSPAVAAGADADELQVAESRLEQSLRPALDSLKNVRTVLWIFTSCPDEFRWTVETVHGFMSSLALLEDFRLASDVSGFARNYDCSFDRITHLRKLTLTSSDALSLGGLCHSASHMVGNNPHLSALHLATDRHWNHPPLHGFADLFYSVVQPLRLTELRLFRYGLRLDHGTILHLRSLRSLWLFSGNPAMWDTLRAERIHLSELHTDMVVEGLPEYISSYSGLERLTIVNTNDEDVDLAQSDRLADKFFSALSHHHQSLVALSCAGAYEGRWSVGGNNVTLLEQLHKLQSLQMNVNSVVAGYKPSTQTGGSGRGARPIIKIENDEDGRNMVHRFLDLVDKLPISDAVIMPSFPKRFMQDTCGNNFVSNRGIIIGEIDKAVQEFQSRASRTSGATVLAGHNYYRVKGSEDRYCAVESANLSWPYSYDHSFGKRS